MDTIEQQKKAPKPAAQPRDKANMLRAKPVKGEVDWAELSREHIARYPNIIAELARAEQRCADRKR
jgi:hypothetical protein